MESTVKIYVYRGKYLRREKIRAFATVKIYGELFAIHNYLISGEGFSKSLYTASHIETGFEILAFPAGTVKEAKKAAMRVVTARGKDKLTKAIKYAKKAIRKAHLFNVCRFFGFRFYSLLPK